MFLLVPAHLGSPRQRHQALPGMGSGAVSKCASK